MQSYVYITYFIHESKINVCKYVEQWQYTFRINIQQNFYELAYKKLILISFIFLKNTARNKM